MEAKWLNSEKLLLSFSDAKEYENIIDSLAARRAILQKKSWDDMPFDSAEPPPGCLFKFSFNDAKKQIEIESNDSIRSEPMKGIQQALDALRLPLSEVKIETVKPSLSCLSFLAGKSSAGATSDKVKSL